MSTYRCPEAATFLYVYSRCILFVKKSLCVARWSAWYVYFALYIVIVYILVKICSAHTEPGQTNLIWKFRFSFLQFSQHIYRFDYTYDYKDARVLLRIEVMYVYGIEIYHVMYIMYTVYVQCSVHFMTRKYIGLQHTQIHTLYGYWPHALNERLRTRNVNTYKYVFHSLSWCVHCTAQCTLHINWQYFFLQICRKSFRADWTSTIII